MPISLTKQLKQHSADQQRRLGYCNIVLFFLSSFRKKVNKHRHTLALRDAVQHHICNGCKIVRC